MKTKYLVFYVVCSASSGLTSHSSGFFDLGFRIQNQEHLDMLRDFIKERVNMKGVYISITGLYDVTPPTPKITNKKGYKLPTNLL
jgi:hypothetical protein